MTNWTSMREIAAKIAIESTPPGWFDVINSGPLVGTAAAPQCRQLCTR
jgi:hypothetical protein